jgi:hypothetical protein
MVVVLAVAVLLAAVAVTAGMARPEAGAAEGVVHVPPLVLFAWVAVAALAGGLALAVFMPAWSPREKLAAALVAGALLLGFLVLAERTGRQIPTQPAPRVQVSPAPSQAAPPPTPASSSAQPGVAVRSRSAAGAATPAPWVLTVVGVGALLIAVLALGAGARARGGGAMGRRTPELDLDAAVAASLLDVEAETDPRRAVVAAWISMGEALARHGMRRAPHEAPVEYMRRALRSVRVSASSVQRLTTLFERARYSDHPATPAMRDEALQVLHSVREELRDRGGTVP